MSSATRRRGTRNEVAPRARTAAFLSFLLAIASIALAAPTSATDDRAAEAHRAHELAKSFRAKFGLRADPVFVDATFGDKRFSNRDWGVPLDSAEAAEIRRRVDVQESLGKALRKAAAEPDSAGAYFDEKAGDTPVFLTKRDPTKARGALGGLIPGNVAARFQQVRFSTKELHALQERINADLRAGRLDADGITSTAVDTRANAVVVGAAVVSDELRTMLLARYGGGVALAVEPESEGGDACVSRVNCLPAKAGIEIRNNYNGNFCTTGPIVRVANSSSLRILTGGHCLGLSGGVGTIRRWTHNGTQLGWSEAYSWSNGADADAGLLNPSINPISGDRNLVYRSSSSDVVGLQGWKPTAEQVQGAVVCRSAAVSGYICGTIALTDKTKSVDGHSIDHQWVVDFDACPGDSGAPYLVGNIAWGVHADSTTGCDPSTNQSWYSPMEWVATTLAAKGHPIEACNDAACTSNDNVWTLRGSLNGEVWSPRMVKLKDGRVLQVGGEGGDPLWEVAPAGPARAPQVFDPTTGMWSDTAPPPWLPARCVEQFAVGLSDGTVLIGGGVSADGGAPDPCATKAYVFDPKAAQGKAWTTVAPMPKTIRSAGAVLLSDGRAFVTGGTGSDGKTSTVLAYAPSTDTWTSVAPAPGGAIAPLVLRLNDGRVMVSGGYVIDDPVAPRYADRTATYLYNPATGAWSTTTPAGGRGVAGAVLSDGNVVIAGGQHLTWNQGQGYSFSTSVRLFSPATGAWISLAPLRTARAAFTLVQLVDGTLLAAGGLTSSTTTPPGVPSTTADVYDWGTNAWYGAASLRAARGDQGSVVLNDGRVLVAGGGTASSETYAHGDLTPPATATPLLSITPPPSITTKTVPTWLSWTASDLGGSGLGTYDVARSVDGGAFTLIASYLTNPWQDANLTSGHTYRFEVRTRDNAGNLGPWKPGATVRPGITQQTSAAVRYTGTWKTASASGYLGGSVKYATSAGASASYTFTGRSIAFMTTRASGRGTARIYVDGVLAATLNLQASTTTYRYVAFLRTWTTLATHTIKIVVVGTAGHPRVDVDAFASLQ